LWRRNGRPLGGWLAIVFFLGASVLAVINDVGGSVCDNDEALFVVSAIAKNLESLASKVTVDHDSKQQIP